MKPGGEGRLATESSDFSEELQECFLRQILCFGRIPHHSET